ncbi:MAG: hypothetical protein MUF42_06375 [Cytophagaceae bacterium]|nr:hypothetical protein [Cytophagaceae bacterium]
MELEQETLMDSAQKKSLLLLKLVIFNYHGLDLQEKKILSDTAMKIEATEELAWAYEFSNQDPVTSFERARAFFANTVSTYDKEVRFSFIKSVWEDTQSKGYVSEIEAMSMLKLAKDWGVQKELLAMVRNLSH